MMDWLKRQWREVRGNLKFAVLCLLATSMLSFAERLTHGLAVWQQVCLATLFVAIVVWALTATFASSKRSAVRATEAATGIEVISADWGVEENEYKPVTRQLKAYIEAKTEDLKASNYFFGDPFPKPKHLLVQYRVKGDDRIKERAFAEGARIRLD